MNGITRAQSQISEINLTISKIDQVILYESGPFSGSGKNSENKNHNFEKNEDRATVF